ncbi:hypothetical protein QBC37DRAFT_54216 [Rhypophila decipiens]|uniref:Uncharacterized protein n=1 Tax=Rhypophila decipiens TaxID=261697 RepID=A0AAN6XZF2_9PEZI|nr:hypothetical protein QBC37DRAFT_54216 [Rhypophila decipiens]
MMATSYSIELLGIGSDRDVDAIHRTLDASPNSNCSRASSTISLPVPDAAKDIPHPPLYPSSSPTRSFVELIPEPVFVAPVFQAHHVHYELSALVDPFQYIERVPQHLTPVNQYVDRLERHERIAHALAAEIKFEKPWQDYLPCPGSGPLSAAGSTTSDCARKPGTPKVVFPAPVYAPSPEPHRPVTPEPMHPHPPIDEPPIMIRRYLEDPYEPDGVSSALDQPGSFHNPPDLGQAGHWDQSLRTEADMSAQQHSLPDAPRNVGFCLGKRARPEWDSDHPLYGLPNILIPDDADNISDAVLSSGSTEMPCKLVVLEHTNFTGCTRGGSSLRREVVARLARTGSHHFFGNKELRHDPERGASELARLLTKFLFLFFGPPWTFFVDVFGSSVEVICVSLFF